jgi:cyclopropane fatty-acyl-phospholipid synthase-like methyltransferase
VIVPMLREAAEVESKNREIYDDTSSPVWQLAIYRTVHHNWEFINLGGAAILDRISALTQLDRNMAVAEFCAGQGAVCRYLAEHYGCGITGVEWNPNQVSVARRLNAKLNRECAAKVEIVESNCQSWRPIEPVDLVISVDSMMLMPDLPAVLENAAACLKPGGQLAIATLGAGERITEETRRIAWEIDGMASLYHCREYAELLDGAGFNQMIVTDITDIAINTSEQIARALLEHEHEIKQQEGKEVFQGWLDVGRWYLAAFTSRSLSYLLVTGISCNP